MQEIKAKLETPLAWNAVTKEEGFLVLCDCERGDEMILRANCLASDVWRRSVMSLSLAEQMLHKFHEMGNRCLLYAVFRHSVYCMLSAMQVLHHETSICRMNLMLRLPMPAAITPVIHSAASLFLIRSLQEVDTAWLAPLRMTSCRQVNFFLTWYLAASVSN